MPPRAVDGDFVAPPEPEEDDDFNGADEMIDLDQDSLESDAAPSADQSMLSDRNLLSRDPSTRRGDPSEDNSARELFST